jgi:hypothetical protein
MEQLPKIVQQRLQATAKAGIHPDPDLLTAFAEKSLNERERAQVLQHLGQCADCRNVVSLAMPEIVAPSTIPARSRLLTWPVLRWGALAACALVVSAAVTLRYERRQSMETMVAEKAPAPVPSATVTIESQASNQPAQKLAAKIAPPSPFRSDRDFETAGKLAKQREDAGVRSAAGAAVISGLETGRLESRQRENNLMGADQRGANQLTNDRLAKADALKSADKPLAPAMGQFAAPVPSSPPAAKSTLADTEEQAKERKDNLDYAAKASNEMVTVEAESTQIETSQAAPARTKDESDKKAQKAATAGPKELPLAARNVDDLRALNKTMPSWTLSPDGALQRSFDSGKTWQTIPVASRVVFRALAANDSDIWVGGAAGALFHSVDAGQHWTQIKPVTDGKPLTADITRIEFTDAQHGRLTTDSHETWITDDGGASWHRN